MHPQPMSVAEYHELIQRGIILDDPIELLEGWLVERPRKTPLHSVCTHLGRDTLEGILPDGWFVISHGAVTTTESEPEPDLLVARGRITDYMTAHPGPADVCLIIEIADATLELDRTVKQRIYARAGIPAYWICNLIDRVVETYSAPVSQPGDPHYTSRDVKKNGETLSFSLPGHGPQTLPVDEVLYQTSPSTPLAPK